MAGNLCTRTYQYNKLLDGNAQVQPDPVDRRQQQHPGPAGPDPRPLQAPHRAGDPLQADGTVQVHNCSNLFGVNKLSRNTLFLWQLKQNLVISADCQITNVRTVPVPFHQF